MCGNKGMMHGMYHHRGGGRILGAIIITLFVFWCGVQFGEMRSYFHNGGGYGYGMMRGGWDGYGYGYGPSMMRGYNYGYSDGYAVPMQATDAASAPAATTN